MFAEIRCGHIEVPKLIDDFTPPNQPMNWVMHMYLPYYWCDFLQAPIPVSCSRNNQFTNPVEDRCLFWGGGRGGLKPKILIKGQCDA